MIDTSSPALFYAIRTKAGKEKSAAVNLEQQGAVVYAPFTKNLRREVRPAFPRYIFAAFDLERMFSKIRSTRGVTGIVRFGDEFAQIERDLLLDIQAHSPAGYVDYTMLDDSPAFRFAVGQVVLLTLGEWYGRKATVAGYSDDDYLLDPELDAAASGFNRLSVDPALFRFVMRREGVAVA